MGKKSSAARLEAVIVSCGSRKVT